MSQSDLAALERQVEESPTDVEARTELALAYSDAGRLDEAAEQLRAALEQEPENLDILLGLASLEHVLDDEEGVQEHLNRAIELAPDNPDVYRLIYQTSDQPDQRADRLIGGARYLELRPDAPDGDQFRDDLVRILEESTGEFEASAGDGADPDSDGLAELLMVMPYLRRGLPAEVIGKLELELHRARARIASKFALSDLPDEEIAAGRARLSVRNSLEHALDALEQIDELGGLDDDSSALRDKLIARRDEDEAALEKLGLDATTEAVFALLEEGRSALVLKQPEVASNRFQKALLALGELGDDEAPPLAHAAALAYDGLAESLVASAPDDADERREQLELAREAADEAARRDPELPQAYRQAFETEPTAAEPAPDEPQVAEEPAPEEEPEPVEAEAEPEPEPEVEPEPEPEAEPEAEPEPEPEPAEELEAELPTADKPEPEAPPSTGPADELPAPEEAVSDVPAAAGETSATALLDDAEEALENNEIERAEGLFEKALTAAEDRRGQARALAGLGTVSLERGRIEAALESAEEAIDTDRGSLQAHLLRGRIKLQQEDWPKALESFQFAEAAAPDDPRVHRGLGLALVELERWDDALPSLEKALAAFPEDPWLCFKMGEAFLGTGNKPSGMVCFEEALNLGLTDPQAGEVRIFLDQETRRQEMRAQQKARPAEAEEESDIEDGGEAAERDAMLREKVLQRSVGGMEYNPLQHKKCPVCRHINEKSASVCSRCGHDFDFVEQKRGAAKGGPCFIATAALHADATEVVLLRAYREQALRPRPLGRAFIKVYETCSPPLARTIAARPALRRLVRRRLIEPLAARAGHWLAEHPQTEE